VGQILYQILQRQRHHRALQFNHLYWLICLRFFTARRKVSFASAIYATAYPSVCLSVKLRYCVKTRERRGMRSSPSGSGSPVSLVFWCQEWLVGDEPIQVKFECKEGGRLPVKNSRAVHISPHNSGTVIDIEKSSVNANRKSTMGFPASYQQRSCVTPNFQKWGSVLVQIPKFVVFGRYISTKNH